MPFRSVLGVATACSLVLIGCQTESLSPQGARVATASSAPIDAGWDPASCKQLGYVVGRGGGSFGGGWITNDQLVEYAMNDLRNKAASMGANYVQHDSRRWARPDRTDPPPRRRPPSAVRHTAARASEAATRRNRARRACA